MTGTEIAVAALVLLAAVMHAVWNALVKADADRTVALAWVLGVGTVIGVAVAATQPIPIAEAWPWLLGSAATHTLYFTGLLGAYRTGDLGRVYPIARGTAPVLVVIVAAVVAAEVPAWIEVAGIVLVSAGILSLSIGTNRGGGAGASTAASDRRRATAFALLTGVTIATYTVLDGTGVRRSGDVLGYTAWTYVVQAPAVLVLVAIAGRARVATYLRTGAWKRGTAGGVVAMGAWAIAIWAMSVVPIAHVAALRETSVIFAAAIGARMLHEPFGRRRIAAAAVVAAGIALLHAG
jgi:drug/metabolite transporter (DMT)-like permease